jgi:hypothetical protein
MVLQAFPPEMRAPPSVCHSPDDALIAEKLEVNGVREALKERLQDNVATFGLDLDAREGTRGYPVEDRIDLRVKLEPKSGPRALVPKDRLAQLVASGWMKTNPGRHPRRRVSRISEVTASRSTS